MADTNIDDEYFFNIEQKWDNFSIQDLELFLSQAEEYLGSTIEISRLATGKAYTAIGFITTFIVTLLGFVSSVFIENGNFASIDQLIATKASSLLAVACFTTTIWLAINLYKLIPTIDKRKLLVKGTEPRILMSTYWLEFKDEDKRRKAILIELSRGCQIRIEKNMAQNNKRVDTISKAIKVIAYTPFVIIGTYLLLFLVTALITYLC